MEITVEVAKEIDEFETARNRVAARLADMAAARTMELLLELASEEPRFIRAIKTKRPSIYPGIDGDPPPVIVEDEILALMTARPVLVGAMVGQWMYDCAVRQEEISKAASAVVEAGLVIARRMWIEKFGSTDTAP
jgi:hypothetical protein